MNGKKILNELIWRGEQFKFEKVLKRRYNKHLKIEYSAVSECRVKNEDEYEYIHWKADVERYISVYQPNEVAEYKKLLKYKNSHNEAVAKLKAIKKINKWVFVSIGTIVVIVFKNWEYILKFGEYIFSYLKKCD
jgi:hypothetical protein